MNKGLTCDRPNTAGEATARIVFLKTGRQGIITQPIEECATRLDVLGQVAEMIASSS